MTTGVLHHPIPDLSGFAHRLLAAIARPAGILRVLGLLMLVTLLPHD